MKSNFIYNIQKYAGLFVIGVSKWLITVLSPDKPVFDIDEFPEFYKIQNNWEIIRDEYLNFIKKSKLHNMSEVFEEQKRIAPGDNWKSAILLIYNEDIDETQKYFPHTTKLIKEYKNISTAFFSVLEHGKKITSHKGPYKGVLRYHLGLIVPESKECYIKIEDKKYYWKNAVSFIFDDTYVHEVQNYGGSERVILFIDFYRPLPFIIYFINKLMVNLIGKSMFIQNVRNNLRKKD